jgi:hypothetical protein
LASHSRRWADHDDTSHLSAKTDGPRRLVTTGLLRR